LFTAFALLPVGAAHVNAAPRETSRPNIILILADDLGVETLGAYGGLSYRTPQLDQLAASGMRFTHAYAQPLCTNTRVQLMTGKYNHRNWLAFGILDPKERTFGHEMQRAGYKTCIVGKWQLQSYDPPDYPGAEKRRGIGMHPRDAGFDEYSLWHTGHTERKGSRYADPVILENGKFLQNTKDRYGEDIWVDYIGDFMKRHRDEPFFVYYPMALPHRPFVPTPDSPEWKDPEKRHRNAPRFYKDMVEYMDRKVGRLVAKVDALGLRERTLILFFGDNGTPQQAPPSRTRSGMIAGGKGLTSDNGIHVPFIANWKGTTPAGTVCDDLIDSTDFLATLFDLTDSPESKRRKIDGRTFLPQLRGKKGDPRDWVFFHYDPRPGWDKDQFRRHRFARDKRFTLYDDGRLFDISKDRDEKRPIAATSDTPAATAARAKLLAVLRSMESD
jgi:arylsulfatase A-like enzyme